MQSDSIHESGACRGAVRAVARDPDAVFPASDTSDSILVAVVPSGWTRNGL